MNNEALKELLYKMADDALVIGHRNSEWTGLGPVLEEDIAFSSMAQDKIGHAFALYNILHNELGEADPDTIGFGRDEKDFKCCHFVEMPIGEYDFSLVRQFLFDHAESERYKMLANSGYEPLAKLAGKIKGEIKYHTLHADVWMRNLGNGTEESNARMQTALNEAFPFALGIFEQGEHEDVLRSEGIFEGEEALKQKWLEAIKPVLEQAKLQLPATTKAEYGGRKGYHTEYLAPMLKEMREVISTEPQAEW